MNHKLHLILLVVLGLTLSACSGKKEQVVVADSIESTPQAEMPVFGTGLTLSQLRDLGINGNPLDYKVVYFEYNSTAIDRRSEVIALAHARELSNRGGAQLTLAGHADERGTRDYNLALGERRSQKVSNLMASSPSGVGGSSIKPVSYGEERPVDPAHNEAAWQKNRRVEIVY